MTDTGSSAPLRSTSDPLRLERGTAVVQSRLHLSQVVSELLAIVRYVTAVDGPLQLTPDSESRLSPWHKRLLLKTQERLEVVDADLRGRVTFFVAAKDHGFRFCDGDRGLAEAALESCRATMLVVEALLAGRLPAEGEFESMSDAVLGIYPAIERRSRTERRLDGPAGPAEHRDEGTELRDRRQAQRRLQQAV